MTMTFSLHESIGPDGAFERIDLASFNSKPTLGAVRTGVPILREKLRIPDTANLVERSRINALLEKSQAQFPATLVSGRSGTGKTALAASLASRVKNVSWYTVESADIEWPVFARYFTAALRETGRGKAIRDGENGGENVTESEIARFLLRAFSTSYARSDEPSLIVLDDIHHLFDAPWFGDFFNLLLYSLPPETHLLLLCRSRPPGPLWRLRSKQMLNVLDEKVIAFTIAETQTLFTSLEIESSGSESAHRSSFGRVSRLLQFVSD